MSISAATYLGEVKVTPPGEFSQNVEIYRCENGMLVGVDARWTGKLPDPDGQEIPEGAVSIHCAYDPNSVHILDPEHIQKSIGASPP